MKKNVYFTIMLLTAFLLLTAGCSQKGHQDRLALIKATNPAPLHISKQDSANAVQSIKKDVRSFPEIYDVAVIKGKRTTLIAYKVKHMQRFRMKAIEKRLNNRLEKKYPNEKFTVSSDYKIFLEVIRLQEKMKNRDISKKQAEKRMNKIIKLSEEMT